MLGQPAQALFVPKRPPSAVPPLQKNAMEQTVENELSKRKAPLLRGPSAAFEGDAAPPSKAAR